MLQQLLEEVQVLNMCKFSIAPESAGLYGAAGDEQSAQEMIS